MRKLDELADELLSDDLKSNQLKITSAGHISTTLNTHPDCDVATSFYGVYGQPAEFEDESQANVRRKKRWES